MMKFEFTRTKMKKISPFWAPLIVFYDAFHCLKLQNLNLSIFKQKLAYRSYGFKTG